MLIHSCDVIATTPVVYYCIRKPTNMLQLISPRKTK